MFQSYNNINKNFFNYNKSKFLFIIFILFIGFFIRFILIHNEGTFDLNYFVGHFFFLKEHSFLNLYYPKFLEIPEWREYYLPSLYPPGYAYILSLFAKISNYLDFYLNNRVLLKILVIFFEITLVIFIFFFGLKNFRSSITKKLILIYWLNPVFFIAGASLGYVDFIGLSFLVISIIFFINDKFYKGTLFYCISILIKQLAIIGVPIIFIYILKKNSISRTIKIFILSLSIFLISFSPFFYFDLYIFDYKNSVLIGLIKNLYWGIFRNDISSNGLNFWWIYSSTIQFFDYWNKDLSLLKNISLLDFKYMKSNVGTWGVESLISKVAVILVTICNMRLLYVDPKKINFVYVLFLQYFAYAILATGVHENHMLWPACIILLLKVFDNSSNFNKQIIIINLFALINIVFFYGISGEGVAFRPSAAWSILSILFSLINIIYFIKTFKLFIIKNYLKIFLSKLY
jgi:hypothetical protein